MRANELQAVILSTLLRRLDSTLGRLRERVETVVQAGEEVGLNPLACRSPADECGTHTGFVLDNRERARELAEALRRAGVTAFCPGEVTGDVFTGWEPVMGGRAAHHPALDPYNFKANRKRTIQSDENTCRKTLDRLGRVVVIRTDDAAAEQFAALRGVLEAAAADNTAPVAIRSGAASRPVAQSPREEGS